MCWDDGKRKKGRKSINQSIDLSLADVEGA